MRNIFQGINNSINGTQSDMRNEINKAKAVAALITLYNKNRISNDALPCYLFLLPFHIEVTIITNPRTVLYILLYLWKKMKVVIFAVIAFAMVTATTLSMTPATAQDKCFTQEERDTGELLTGCSEFSADQDQLKESKKECKETAKETNSKCNRFTDRSRRVR